MRILYNLVLLIFIATSLNSQEQKRVLGTPSNASVQLQKNQPATVQNGNGTINTSYTVSACGLNFVQASVRLHQRSTAMTPPKGVIQPATLSISGIPPCATITKAFLYTGGSGNGVAITANLTNPALTPNSFPMTMIGTHIDKCWSYVGTYMYRADVTSAISGNGTYTLSGIPCLGGPPNDMDGATLIIIYADPTQSYTGSFVIADGAWVSNGGPLSKVISGFNVCATPILTNHFMIVDDLQQIATAQVTFNSSSSNHMFTAASQNMWDFIQAPGAPLVGGQTSANYGLSNSSDCFAIAAAGAYFRTSCMACTGPTFSLTVAATSSCTVGSATATPAGGVGPYTYTWSPTGGNASTVTGVPPGIYTVAVKDASCGIATRTINIPGSPTVSVTNSTICAGNNATLTANGASTYSWNTGATTSQIVVSPTVSTSYTVTGSNGSCNDTKTVSVTVNASPTVNISASNTIICTGQTVTLTASGGNTYLWSTSSTNTTIVVGPFSTTTYSVTGSVPGCSVTKTISISVSALPTVSVSSSNSVVCSGSSTLTVSGTATSFTWSTGATTSQIVVSPTVNTIYTVVGSNGVCSVSRSIAVAAGVTPTVTAATSNSFICAGQTVTLSASGASSYTFNPGGITGNPIALAPSSSVTYTVLGNSGGPCTGSASISQVVSPCTGISQLSGMDPEFSVYPNPNSGEFTLTMATFENCSIEIYNTLGQLVRKNSITQNVVKIDLADEVNGVYYLRLIINGSPVQKTKIVKE